MTISLRGQAEDVFKWVNSTALCTKCREERVTCRNIEQQNGFYSNVLPGFISEELSVPIDVLIVGQSHGGRQDLFRSQKTLQEEMQELSNYYLREKLMRFHQKAVREFLTELDACGKSWAFTDLIKCFVSDKPPSNKRRAAKHCRSYLDRQIQALAPRTIVALGGLVADLFFGVEKLNHGQKYTFNYGDAEVPVIVSIFPSARTVDRWIAEGEWNPILCHLK